MLRQLTETRRLNFASALLYVILLIGLMEAAIGLFQYFSFAQRPDPSLKTPVIGTLGIPNAFGLTMALSATASLILCFKTGSKTLKILYLILLPLFMFVLFLNGSRGAALAFIITAPLCTFIYFYMKSARFYRIVRIKEVKYIVSLLSLLVILLITVFLYTRNMESSSGRWMIWRISVPMVTDQPLTGVGYGKYGFEYLNYQAKFFSDSSNMSLAYKAANLKQPHNEFLSVFCETGLTGGFLFILFLLSVLYSMIKFLKISANHSAVFIVNLALLSFTCLILLHGLVDDTLHFFPSNILFYVLVGLTPVSSGFFHLRFAKSRIAAILIFVFSLIGLHQSLKLFAMYKGYQNWAVAQKKVKAGRAVAAIPYYKKALSVLSSNGELLFHYGSSLVQAGKYYRGIDVLKRSLRTFNDRNIHLSLGYAYLKTYDLSRAEREAKTALSMFPDHLAPHLLLGRIYYKTGDIEQSKRSLLKCMNMKTKRTSRMTSQIQREARNLWRAYYGR